MQDFFGGLGEDQIEIGDGIKPEDISEEDAPIIKYVHSVIKDALEMRASDIHMEPLEKKFRIRFRVDGKLKSNLIQEITAIHNFENKINGQCKSWPRKSSS